MRISVEGAEPTDERRLSEYGLQIDSLSSWRMMKSRGTWNLTYGTPPLRLTIDFDEPGPDYHRRSPKPGSELIVRALGKKSRRVVDLSAGLGQDAVFLSQLGFAVTALERNPLLAFLLAEARRKSARQELQSLEFLWVDAKDWLRDLPQGSEAFDAVYFDPMYPEKKKAALPRQEMRLFRELVGDDDDAGEILDEALRGPWSRVVVKRPLRAEPLRPGARHQFEGRTVRYDVYVRTV